MLAMEVQAATTKKIGEVTKELAIQAPTQSAEKQMTNWWPLGFEDLWIWNSGARDALCLMLYPNPCCGLGAWFEECATSLETKLSRIDRDLILNKDACRSFTKYQHSSTWANLSTNCFWSMREHTSYPLPPSHCVRSHTARQMCHEQTWAQTSTRVHISLWPACFQCARLKPKHMPCKLVSLGRTDSRQTCRPLKSSWWSLVSPLLTGNFPQTVQMQNESKW